MAKTRAIPGSHRDNYLPKEQHLCPDVSPCNAYSLNRRAVSVHKIKPFDMKRHPLMILCILSFLTAKGQSDKTVYLGMNLLQIPTLTVNGNMSFEIKPYLSPTIDLGYTFNYSKGFDFIGDALTPHCKCANDGYDLKNQSGGYLKLGVFLNLRKDFSRRNYPFIGLFLTNSFVHENGIYLPPEQSIPIEIQVNQTKYIIGFSPSLGYELSLTERLKSNIEFQISLPSKKYQDLYGYRNYIPGMGYKDYEGYWFPMLILNLKYRL